MSDLPYSLQQDLFQRKTQAMQFVAQGASTDPQTLGRLLGIANTWPTMKPGAVLSLAQSGYDRLSPETRRVAQLSTQQDMNQQAWHQALPVDLHANVNSLTAPTQGASSLTGMNTGQLFDLYQTFHSDVKQVDNGKISADKFKAKWNVDPENDAEGMKRTEDALVYALGQQDQGNVKGLFRQHNEDYKSFNQYLGQVKQESSIAQDMKSVGESLPMQAIKGVTREAGAIANIGLQGIQGSIRNVAGGGNPLFSSSGATVGQQTDVGQQYQNLLTGGDTSLGNGFLPDPQSAPAQQALAVQRSVAPTIGGHAFTLGRAVASHIVEPDTDAFNVLSGIVDAPIAYYGDPSSRIIGGVGELRQAAKTFTPETVNTLANATGIVPTTSRLFLNQTTKANYLAGADFERDITKIAAKAGPDLNTSSVYRAIASKNPNFPITTVHGQPVLEELTAAMKSGDVDAARDAVAKATQITGPLQPPGVTYNLTKSTPPRMLATMPTGTFPDLSDKKAVWTVLDDTMKSANVPMVERDAALHTMITDPSPMAGIAAAQNAIEKSLIAYGHDPDAAHSMATFFRDAHTTSRAFDIDQETQLERIKPGVGIAGEAVPVPAPMLLNQGLNGGLTIPDPRQLRRAASDFTHLTSSAPWKVTQTAINYPATLWKPLQVLTARMAVKIFGETQLNLAARGMVNMFTKPIQALGAIIGTNYDSRLATWLDKLPGLDARYLLDPEGYGIIRDGDNTLMHTANFLHDPETIATKGYMTVPITHPQAGEGMAEQLGRMHSDPIWKGIAEQPNPQAAKDWFWGSTTEHVPGNVASPEEVAAAKARLSSDDVNVGGPLPTPPSPYGEGVTFATHKMMPLESGAIPPDSIHVDLWKMAEGRRGQEGLAVGKQVLRDADTSGTTLFTSVAREGIGKTAGIADHDRLVQFYKRFGFKEVDPKTIYGEKMGETFAGDSTVLRRDPVPQTAGGVREVQLADEAGVQARLARAPITKANDEYYMQQVAAGKLTSYDPIGDIANDRQAADRYIDKVVFPSMNDMTGGGHNDLMDAIRTGKLNGRVIYNIPGGRTDLGVVDQRAAQYAKLLLDQGIGPKNVVPIRETVSRASSEGQRAAHYARQAEDALFHGLVDLPDQFWNRKLALAQLKWENTIRDAPYLSADDLATLKETALTSRLSNDQARRMAAVVPDVTSARRLTIPQLTQLSKLNAVDDLKGIVHDLTTRSQGFDMVRALVPFGDAFRLVATRLAKLVNEQPQVLRRFQQGIQEAQSPGSSTVNKLLGDPVPQDQGFFHTDANGEEVFTAPGSTLVDQSLLGVPIPLTGQVSGLSMIGEGYPGLGGPSLTLPAKWLLPDTPVGNDIRDIIFPMGGGQSQGLAADLGGALIPSWMNKMITGPADQKTMASTTLEVMRTLYSQGGYDRTNPADMARLANDAKHDARWLYFIRGAAQFVSPGAPAPDFQVQDKTGNMAEAQAIINKYHEHQAADGSDKALQWLISNFGTKNIFLSQSASAPNSYAAPTTREAQNWVDNNPGVSTKYPLTYGLFAPQGQGTFSQDAYNEQFVKGERRSLSPQEQIAQAENRLGYLAYNRKRQAILDSNDGGNLTKNQTAWLRDYRTYLQGQFPGFDSYLASPYDSQKRRNAAITELQSAAKDGSITNTDAGQGLVQYLHLRDKAVAAAKEQGLASPFQAKSARPMRDYLRDGADWVVKNHPEFRPIFEQIFSHEMVADPAKTAGG